MSEKEGLLPITGLLVNQIAPAGCGWLIHLDKDGCSILEPTNLEPFKFTLVDGKKVKFTHKERGTPSNCMIGKVVDMKFIEDN